MTNPRFQAPRSAYVHVPFCRHRCGYCSFTVVAGRDDLVDLFAKALTQELAWLEGPHRVDTLYIGGGTPTHLELNQLQRLLDLVLGCFPLREQAEFTVEANPADVSREKLDLLHGAGVNRISFGVQSFDPAKLLILERDHRRAHVEQALDLARGMFDLSLDLIFGAPNETLATWQADLAHALRLAPDHVSTYGLTYERGTRFWARLAKGELEQLAESVELAMYESALDRLPRAGLQHYEISSFARSGRRCRHNEAYWTGQTYFGAGPGAARHIAGRREMNHRSTTTYLRRVLDGQSPVTERESLSPEDSARERLVLALRRVEGVDKVSFRRETGYSVELLLPDQWCGLVDRGLVQDNASGLRLTRAGILVCDSICSLLLAALPTEDGTAGQA